MLFFELGFAFDQLVRSLCNGRFKQTILIFNQFSLRLNFLIQFLLQPARLADDGHCHDDRFGTHAHGLCRVRVLQEQTHAGFVEVAERRGCLEIAEEKITRKKK